MRLQFQALIDRLRHPESFLGPVLTLVSGTAVAHLITAGALVILARLFSPAEFGILGMFTAIFFSITVISCLRFDIAIPIPKEDEDAAALVGLSILSAISVAAASTLIVAVFPQSWLDRAGIGAVAPFLWFLPVAFLASGLFTAVQTWFVRRRNYARIARARAAQSLGAAATQIGAGLMAAGPIGLIMGVVLNNGTGAIVMARAFLADMKATGGWPTAKKLRGTAREYARFPIYSTWEALANSLAIQIPILLVASLTNEAELGQLMMAMNVVQAPLALFGTATSQVYLSQAPEKARNGQLVAFTQRTIIHLLRVGIPFMAAIALLAPWGFPILFGAEWARAGVLAAWMAPWLLLQFAFGPVSLVFHILGRQRLAMALQLSGLVLRAGITFAGGILLVGKASEFYALSGAVFYGVAMLAILFLLRIKSPSTI